MWRLPQASRRAGGPVKRALGYQTGEISLFERLKLASAAKRLLEEKLYEKVVEELATGHKRNGLWAKAIANSNGVEEKAKALYIQYRVQSIKDEEEIFSAIAEETAKQAALDEQLKSKQKAEKEGNNIQQNPENQQRVGHHHWSDDYRTHEKVVIVCSKCSDIHHGEGFIQCEGCSASLNTS